MESYLPVVHSTLAPEPLVAAVWTGYRLANPTSCRLMKTGFNDHYYVATPKGDYVLRVYQHGWRTADDIAYELAVLTHLEACGVRVCGPILRRDGAYHCVLPALEGPRVAALFPFAAGRAPDAANAEENRACGRTMALIHHHTDDFPCQHARFQLDLDHLINEPVEVVVPFLTHRPADLTFVRAVAREICAGLEGPAGGLEWGYCHGDFPGNLRVDASGDLRVFDFDCGGPGWRAYDLAVCQLGFGTEEVQWEVFCQGYEEVRPIPKASRAAIPWLIVARQLWRTALFAKAGSRRDGTFYVNDGFFDHHLGVLRERLSKHLPDLNVE